MIIDIQDGFMNKEYYRDLSKRIEAYLKTTNYDKVIFTKYKNDKSKNNLYQTKIGWHGLKTQESQNFTITPPTDAIIFEKYGYGLSRKDLDYIKSLNVNEIDICGLKANACVYAISLQLFDMNIYPNIIWNLVECEPELKDAMKNIFIKQFGNVCEDN